VVLSGTGTPDARRARWNEGLLPVLNLLPVSRELWSRAYLQAVEALTRERIRALYRVAIDFDRRFPSRVGLLESWRGEMLLIEGSFDALASMKTRASMRIATLEPRPRSFRARATGSLSNARRSGATWLRGS
jgi:hypothetical protein